MSETRKHLPAETKIQILQQFLQKKVPVSEISKKYDLNPQYVYQWQTQLFAEGAMVFERKNDKRTGKAASERNEKRIEELELEIQKKNEVISELMAEYVKTKKQNGGS